MAEEQISPGVKVRIKGDKQVMVILSGPDAAGCYKCQWRAGSSIKTEDVAGVALEIVKPVVVGVTWLGRKR